MCVVSMIGEHFTDKWQATPWVTTLPIENPILFNPPSHVFNRPVSQEDFDTLKREVQDCKQLLKKAQLYDKYNGEPNCETDAKLNVLREVAKLVGVELGV